MRIMRSESIPRWLWRLSLIVLVGAVSAAGLLLMLALGGISNPRHIGELVVRDDLNQDAGWVLKSGKAQGSIGEGVYQVVVSDSKARALVPAPYQVRSPCTIIIAARQIDGPTDAGYGLWWGDASGDYHVAAVNGDGYLTVFQSVDETTETIMDWQVFPRIHLQGETNTLQIDIEDAQILVRVNDEVAATFDGVPDRSLQIGFYVETLSTGGTIVDFDWLAIWETSYLS